MSFVQDFKAFAIKGNVVDMAVGIIIGAAFGKVVSSLVGDVIMPPLGLVIGGVDFTSLAVTLKPAAPGEAAVALSYGKFIQNVMDFTIVAFSIFVAVKVVNTLRNKEEKVPTVPPTKQEQLLTEIRDLLRERPAPTKTSSRAKKTETYSETH